MMGKDVERILSGINDVKDVTSSCIISLANSMSYRITSDAQHGGLSTGPCVPEEIAVPSSAFDFISPIKSAIDTISSDCIKMDSLNKGLYVSSSEFNNSYGSPWTELNKLTESIMIAETYASSHESLSWLSEKAALLGLLNNILNTSIDAKWALTTYNDYIQRGYDNKFNDNNPSITFTTGIEKETTGNINQDFDENVHVKQPSIDPF